MKLTINGDMNRYYVQTLCMIFFPGAKFSETEIYTDVTPEVGMTVAENESEISICVHMKANGKSASHSHTVSLSEYETVDKAKKLCAGHVIFHCGREVFDGYSPPWGIHTGVRPAKMAMEFINQHMSRSDIIKKFREEYFLSEGKAELVHEIASREKRIIDDFDGDKDTEKEKLCSVYVSIPFCPTRCEYCSFVSYTSPKLLSLIPDYLVQLKSDIRKTFALIKSLGMRVASVYIGGGTPTTLNEGQLEDLLVEIERNTDASSLLEYTLEAGRPDTITAEKVRIAKEHGVTRMSVNAQTTNDAVLHLIGRNHTAAVFLRSFDIVRSGGIRYINTDLIAGLPGETRTSFKASLDKVVSLAPENVTVHTFCVKKAAEILQKDDVAGLYTSINAEAEESIEYSQKKLVKEGYRPYYMYKQKNTTGNLENTGFSKDGCECIYNIFMMEEIQTIFAAGAGAVTKFVRKNSAGKPEIKRIFLPKYPYEYLRNANSPKSERGDFYENMSREAGEFFSLN